MRVNVLVMCASLTAAASAMVGPAYARAIDTAVRATVAGHRVPEPAAVPQEQGAAATPSPTAKPAAVSQPHSEKYDNGLWGYYNIVAPIFYEGSQYYEVLLTYTFAQGRKSEGHWATTQWIAGVHVNNLKLPWKCDESPCIGDTIEYDTFAVTAVYGHRYYPFADEFEGLGFGWLVAIGFYDETELEGDDGAYEWPSDYDGPDTGSGDTETAVADLYYTLRLGALWVEPSLLFGFEKRGDPAFIFIPGLRLGFAL